MEKLHFFRLGLCFIWLGCYALCLPACVTDDGPENRQKEFTLPQLGTLRLTTNGTILEDAAGREVILRGVNGGTRSKFFPFMPFDFRESGESHSQMAPPFEEALSDYFDYVDQWGYNVIRLLFSWEALEPTKGVYDEEYVERYVRVIKEATERNIRVIIDFHQDVFASPYCGDGFPLWTLPEPVPERPKNCDNWFNQYLGNTPTREAFDRFWNNQDGIMDAFEEMWRYMVSRTWPMDGVVGYEIINEPAAGKGDEAKWARETLTPFYSKMAAAIHSLAPEALVFIDNAGTSSASAQTYLELPAGENLVFAPHYYDPAIFLVNGWGGTDPGNVVGALKILSDGWNIPILLGEFGIPSDATRADEYLRACYESFDEHLFHATVWEFSMSVEDWNNEGFGLLNSEGQENITAVEAARPYPAAVAGQLKSFQYDTSSSTGTLSFQSQKNGVTEIRLPARFHTAGVHGRVEEGAADWFLDESSTRLFLRTTADGAIKFTFYPATD